MKNQQERGVWSVMGHEASGCDAGTHVKACRAHGYRRCVDSTRVGQRLRELWEAAAQTPTAFL